MANSGTHIRDVGVLDELVMEFERCGSQMSRIDTEVCIYLDSVRNDLQRQLDYIHDRLRSAEQRLSNAEAALSACLSSSECPICISEQQEVTLARMEVEKWRIRDNQGQQIFFQCNQEINDYHGGGHQLVQSMCNEQTPQATHRLSDIHGMLHDILHCDTVMTEEPKDGTPAADAHKSDAKPVSEDSRFDDFRNNIRHAPHSQNNASAGSQMHTMSKNASILRPMRFQM